MNTNDIFKLLKDIMETEIKKNITNSYGNEFYGNKDGDSYIVTKGICMSTKGKFSEHYLNTGFVTDVGKINSIANEINIDLLTVFHNGKYIDIKVIQGEYYYKITHLMKKVLMKLLRTYNILEISNSFTSNTSITTINMILKRKIK